MFFELRTDTHIIGYVNCNPSSATVLHNQNCHILELSIGFVCAECKNLFMLRPLNVNILSFKTIEFYEQKQLYSIPGRMTSPRTMNLAGQIVHFANTEKSTLKYPLESINRNHVKYPDIIQSLGLAYASIYLSSIGNLSGKFEGCEISVDICNCHDSKCIGFSCWVSKY